MKKAIFPFLFFALLLSLLVFWPIEDIHFFWKGQVFEFNLWGLVALIFFLLLGGKFVGALWDLPKKFFIWRSKAHQKKAEEAWKLSLISLMQKDWPQVINFAEEAGKWNSLKAQSLLVQLHCMPSFSSSLLLELKRIDSSLALLFEDSVEAMKTFPNLFSLRIKGVQTLLDQGNVREALKEIQDLKPLDTYQKNQCQRLRAELWLKAAEAPDLAQGEKDEFLQDAWRADSSWAWPAIVYARFLFNAGNSKRAFKVLNNAWIHTGDFKVVQTLFEMKSLPTPLARLAEAQKLITENTPPWSNIWLVSLCLDAKLFGEAERLLKEIPPSLLKQVLIHRLGLLRIGGEEPKDFSQLRDLLLHNSYSEGHVF